MAEQRRPEANPDLLWADLPTLRWELNVSEHDSDAAIQLPRLLGAAIDEVERYIRLPIRPHRLTRNVRFPAPGLSVRVTDAPYLLQVDGVDYHPGGERPPPGLAPADPMMTPGGMPAGQGDFTCEPVCLDEPWGPWWIRPRQGGWPEQGAFARARVTTGLRPAEHQAVSQALIMLTRDYYEGVSVADRMPAWRRRLSGMPYRLFWNPRSEP